MVSQTWATAPPPLDPRTLPGPVWVVAPHPDDEALGCGALLCALTDLGQEVWALLLTDGGFSHPASRAYPRPRLGELRLHEWRSGLAQLGVPPDRTRALGLLDGALSGYDPVEVREAVGRAFAAAPPGTVLMPWSRDPHPDHRAAWKLVGAAVSSEARRLAYTVWLPERGGPADWPAPNEATPWRFAVGAARSRKAAAVAAHATQLGLITDDPAGFTLAPGMVERALDGPELYFEVLPPTKEIP
ncbi:PIG-L deacetylase family protein [Deinococcus aerophilus]|uniref:PIG-L domain-containing protein n=1 Tax=Deinococcus aerophilus TaxID=522488 RepID=A0ABQ2GJ39_9DEIO|nr:PIG-L deacetylase family protein [Deinococcus aerophilus]GGL98695.1 PIG-L domain-containing protein [Deinococcus aerophilus]